ncbi:glycosyltransferase family 4 protein [Patescibacteria group bacterium]
MESKYSFNIIANGVWGPEGMSGGDNIFINFARILKKLGHEVNVFTWEDGYELCRDNGLKDVNFHLIRIREHQGVGFYPFYLLRTLRGIQKVRQVINQGKFKNKKVIIYSASDFYPDSLPGYFFKKWLPQSRWVAGFYLSAPHPFKGFRGDYQEKIHFPKFRDLAYWLSQKPIFWLVSKKPEMISVTSQPEVKPFLKAGRKKKELFIAKGGIDYQYYRQFQKPVNKIYEAVYLGRLHPQKGVVEMMDIWQRVVAKKPDAKLAVIGDGPMRPLMMNKVRKFKIKKNVKFFGYVMGKKRDRIIQKGKVILHPAIYDSGGMAAVSGLACGLPGVSFNLKIFKTYYPNGFLRVKTGDFTAFAEAIISLLNNQKLWTKISQSALREAQTWDWESRTKELLSKIEKL